MQIISGLNISAYWISNIIFDMVKAIIPCAITIGLMYAFSVDVSEFSFIILLVF